MPNTTYNYANRPRRRQASLAMILMVRLAILLVIAIFLASTLAGCRRDSGGQGGYNATATFGAIEYRAQLTAIAGQETPQP